MVLLYFLITFFAGSDHPIYAIVTTRAGCESMPASL